MENLEKFYINGRWVTPNSTETMPVSNPATEQKIGRITLGNGTDVDRAVTAALTAFEEFSQTSKAQRLSLLLRLKSVTEARFEDLAQAMRIEMGAPISMARDAQADAAIGHLIGFIEALETLEERLFAMRGLARKHDVHADALADLAGDLEARLLRLDAGADNLNALRAAQVPKALHDAHYPRLVYRLCGVSLWARCHFLGELG